MADINNGHDVQLATKKYWNMLFAVLEMSLFIKSSTKVLIYWLLVLIGSFSHEFFPIPASYLSDKQNVMNQYFVKLSWGWTCSLLALFIACTSSIYTKLNWKLILKNISRLAVSTVVWFVWVNLFEFVLNMSGHCDRNDYRNSSLDKRSCRRQGFTWTGFDISGHTFLLIYCLLVIREEVEIFYEWQNIGTVIRNGDNIQPDVKKSRLQGLYTIITPFIVVVTIALGILSFLWEFMLVCTSFYFHTVAEKVLGYLIAVASWFVTYHVWYKEHISPGCPPGTSSHGHNVLDLIKTSQ